MLLNVNLGDTSPRLAYVELKSRRHNYDASIVKLEFRRHVHNASKASQDAFFRRLCIPHYPVTQGQFLSTKRLVGSPGVPLQNGKGVTNG